MKYSVTCIYSQHDQGFGHSGYLMSFWSCSVLLHRIAAVICADTSYCRSDLCWYIVLPQWSVLIHRFAAVICADTSYCRSDLCWHIVLPQWSVLIHRIAAVICADTSFCRSVLCWYIVLPQWSVPKYMSFCINLTCVDICLIIYCTRDLDWHMCQSVLRPWSVLTNVSCCVAPVICTDTCVNLYRYHFLTDTCVNLYCCHDLYWHVFHYVLHEWSVLTRVSLRIAPVICTDTCFITYCISDLYWHVFHYVLLLWYVLTHGFIMHWPCTDICVILYRYRGL